MARQALYDNSAWQKHDRTVGRRAKRMLREIAECRAPLETAQTGARREHPILLIAGLYVLDGLCRYASVFCNTRPEQRPSLKDQIAEHLEPRRLAAAKLQAFDQDNRPLVKTAEEMLRSRPQPV